MLPFLLADRRGRDEEERIARGWRLRRELADTGAGQSGNT